MSIGQSDHGGEWVCGTTAGIPVWSNGTHQIDTPNVVPFGTGTIPPTRQELHRRAGIYGTGGASNGASNGANVVSVTDGTNYSSTYTVDIVGKFGRAS